MNQVPADFKPNLDAGIKAANLNDKQKAVLKKLLRAKWISPKHKSRTRNETNIYAELRFLESRGWISRDRAAVEMLIKAALFGAVKPSDFKARKNRFLEIIDATTELTRTLVRNRTLYTTDYENHPRVTVSEMMKLLAPTATLESPNKYETTNSDELLMNDLRIQLEALKRWAQESVANDRQYLPSGSKRGSYRKSIDLAAATFCRNMFTLTDVLYEKTPCALLERMVNAIFDDKSSLNAEKILDLKRKTMPRTVKSMEIR